MTTTTTTTATGYATMSDYDAALINLRGLAAAGNMDAYHALAEDITNSFYVRNDAGEICPSNSPLVCAFRARYYRLCQQHSIPITDDGLCDVIQEIVLLIMDPGSMTGTASRIAPTGWLCNLICFATGSSAGSGSIETVTGVYRMYYYDHDGNLRRGSTTVRSLDATLSDGQSCMMDYLAAEKNLEDEVIYAHRNVRREDIIRVVDGTAYIPVADLRPYALRSLLRALSRPGHAAVKARMDTAMITIPNFPGRPARLTPADRKALCSRPVTHKQDIRVHTAYVEVYFDRLPEATRRAVLDGGRYVFTPHDIPQQTACVARAVLDMVDYYGVDVLDFAKACCDAFDVREIGSISGMQKLWRWLRDRKDALVKMIVTAMHNAGLDDALINQMTAMVDRDRFTAVRKMIAYAVAQYTAEADD